MAPFEPGLAFLCLALCAPAGADAGADLPPPDLLEFLGEFGSDDGGLIDPTRLPPPPAPQPTAPVQKSNVEPPR